MRNAFDETKVPLPFPFDVEPSTSRVGSVSSFSVFGASVSSRTFTTFGAAPGAASFFSIVTCAAVLPKFDTTTPHGAPAASLKSEYSFLRSAAQNSQPTFEPHASAALQLAAHSPPKQNSPV